MENLLGLGVFGTFGQPHGYQQAFNFDVEFSKSLDLDHEEISLFPGAELYSVKREFVNGVYSIAFCLYSYAREMNANRNGTFIGSTIVLQQVYVDPNTIYKLLRELHDDIINNAQNLSNNTIQVRQAVNLNVKEPAQFQTVKFNTKTIENTPYYSTKVNPQKKFFIHPGSVDNTPQVVRFFDEALKSYKDAETLYFSFSDKIFHYVNKKGAIKVIEWEDFTSYLDGSPRPPEPVSSMPKAAPTIQEKAVQAPFVPPASTVPMPSAVSATVPLDEANREELQKMVDEYDKLIDYSKQMRDKLDSLLLKGQPAPATTGNSAQAPPAPVTIPTPAPVPEPKPIPVPEPQPAPIQEPKPVPVSEPKPAPVPEPEPKPAPAPVPIPEPLPVQKPAPEPVPAPTPAPPQEPAPAPKPAPPVPPVVPKPEPAPKPAPPLPKPEPAPKPVPPPAPKPEPAPSPKPAPKPQPAPAPKPAPPPPKPAPPVAPQPQYSAAKKEPVVEEMDDEPTPFYKKKGVIIGVLLILVVGAVGAFLYKKNSSKQTETWAASTTDSLSMPLSHDNSTAHTAPATTEAAHPQETAAPQTQTAPAPAPVPETAEEKPAKKPAAKEHVDVKETKPKAASETPKPAEEEQAAPHGKTLSPAPNGELGQSEVDDLNQFGIKNMFLSELTAMIMQKFPSVGNVYQHQAKDYAVLLMQVNKGCFKKTATGYICISDGLHHIPLHK